MKAKKIIKLINDERTLLSVRNAVGCDATSFDGGCYKSNDHAACAVYAADHYCTTDIGACIQGAHDYCMAGAIDTEGCYGAGVVDQP